MKLYRVEHPNSSIGLWYHKDNQKYAGLVQDLNLSGKDLPMGFDPEISKGRWRSAADSLIALLPWFSHDDLAKLQPLGYKLYEITTDSCVIHTTDHYTHALFQDDSVIQRVELDIDILLNRS
jgi:hypothetical protein